MTIRQAIPFMRGPNYYVPSLFYAVDVGLDSFVRADLGPPVAANATGILNAQSINTAGSTGTFAAALTIDVMGRYGRNVTVVVSGAATSAVTVEGLDYLGQPITETLTLNGTTPVLGQKAFKYITNVSWALTAATTINLGWGTRLGLPYRAVNTVLNNELVSGATPTAGALTAGATVATTQTATTADPRGYYTPHSSFLPDGTRTYTFVYAADVVDGLHGNRHFKA